MATAPPAAVSENPNARPFTIGVPTVEKYAGEMAFIVANSGVDPGTRRTMTYCRGAVLSGEHETRLTRVDE